jgi:hypothetical protein
MPDKGYMSQQAFYRRMSMPGFTYGLCKQLIFMPDSILSAAILAHGAFGDMFSRTGIGPECGRSDHSVIRDDCSRVFPIK